MNNKEKLIELDKILYEFGEIFINNKTFGSEKNNIVDIHFGKLRWLSLYKKCFPQYLKIEKLIEDSGTGPFYIQINLDSDSVKISCEYEPRDLGDIGEDIIAFKYDKYFDEIFPLLEEYLMKRIKEEYMRFIKNFEEKKKHYNNLVLFNKHFDFFVQ